MIESLDEFGQMNEFSEMDDILSGMMAKASDNQAETTHIREIR